MVDYLQSSWNGICAKKVGVGKHLAASFPKTYRSVLAPSWCVEQSSLENQQQQQRQQQQQPTTPSNSSASLLLQRERRVKLTHEMYLVRGSVEA